MREDCIYFSMDNILSIISRYLRGASTEEEIKALYSWLSESEENRQLFAGLSANISLHKNATDIDVDNQKEKMLSRLNARIDASEEKKRRVSVFVWAAGLATAAAMVLGLFLSKPSESPVTKDTLLCNNTEATHLYNLPDGSKVCLMPGTSISYNVSGTDERHIRLDGNGFFDIAKDSLRPMTVMTKDVNLRVLGTSFTVKSKQGYQDTEVVLETGSVRITTPAGVPLVCLSPDQKAVFRSETSDIRIESIAATPYVVSNYSIVSLTNSTVREIIDAIEMTFKVKVSISGTPDSKRYNFNFLKSDSPADVIKVLELLTGQDCSLVSGKN